MFAMPAVRSNVVAFINVSKRVELQPGVVHVLTVTLNGCELLVDIAYRNEGRLTLYRRRGLSLRIARMPDYSDSKCVRYGKASKAISRYRSFGI